MLLLIHFVTVSVEPLEEAELGELACESALEYAGVLVNEGKFALALAAYQSIETEQAAFNAAQVPLIQASSYFALDSAQDLTPLLVNGISQICAHSSTVKLYLGMYQFLCFVHTSICKIGDIYLPLSMASILNVSTVRESIGYLAQSLYLLYIYYHCFLAAVAKYQ